MCVVDTSMGSSGPHVSCHAKIYIILKQHMPYGHSRGHRIPITGGS